MIAFFCNRVLVGAASTAAGLGDMMSEQRTISGFFKDDHDRLDALFQSFQTLKRQDLPKAGQAFRQFKEGLARHIAWEEELLFPLWEEKTGMYGEGPTYVMRNEHRQIEAQLEAIHQKVAEYHQDSDKEEQALMTLLNSHNLKEERILYPSVDQVATREECGDIFGKMEEITKERYRACT